MLEIERAHQPAFTQLGLHTFEQVAQFFAAHDPASPRPAPAVDVRSGNLPRAGQPALPVFYKEYRYPAGSWRFLFRRSKARCEFDNYQVFRRLGVPCAERVAWGEQRDILGRLERAFLITVAIPNSQTLIEFVRQQCPLGGGRDAQRLRQVVAVKLARMVRRIHDVNFFHNDLVWRNVLVTWAPPAEPDLWWIDCPRGSFDHRSPWRRRRRIKDLASLDLLGARLATRSDRMLLLRAYLEEARLSDPAKRLLRAVHAYRRQRWPSDWMGQ